jgi:hypothetical protein
MAEGWWCGCARGHRCEGWGRVRGKGASKGKFAEQIFGYDNRATKDNSLTDADRFTLEVSQISGKRLTPSSRRGAFESKHFKHPLGSRGHET